jgi:ABC-type cobalamin/Fe3+-siderophores transport system ATPase subunit
MKEREVVCLSGRNRAGKTTTIRSVIGLTPPRSSKNAVWSVERRPIYSMDISLDVSEFSYFSNFGHLQFNNHFWQLC